MTDFARPTSASGPRPTPTPPARQQARQAHPQQPGIADLEEPPPGPTRAEGQIGMAHLGSSGRNGNGAIREPLEFNICWRRSRTSAEAVPGLQSPEFEHQFLGFDRRRIREPRR